MLRDETDSYVVCICIRLNSNYYIVKFVVR